ncbi:MAG: hypothetical protein J0M36_04130 [Caulobacterales bacterium]|nr:hypothetical protein [Caulobacterales bacterium]
MGDVLAPAYLAAWAAQIGALSAFMGGFASTILVMLLTHDSRRWAVKWAAGLSALSAVAFIVAAVATTTLVAGSHAEAPASVARQAAHGPARLMAVLFFSLGAYGLIAAIGCAGWVRSKRMGWATTVVAGLGAVAVTLNFVTF